MQPSTRSACPHVGVFLCDFRPSQEPDGQWSCRAAGGTGGVPYRYPAYPWGPPPHELTGYDALDPWLGGRGSSER
jgi:hypothetical protein